MRFTGPAGALPDAEQQTILRVAATIGVPATFLAAIRLAENGGAGREFGVLDVAATTYEAQAEVAARSIRNNAYRYVTATTHWPTDDNDHFRDDFVVFMQRRWAPLGAGNDPKNLNANWVKNLTDAYRASGLID